MVTIEKNAEPLQQAIDALPYLSPQQIAARYGVNQDTVCHWIKNGVLIGGLPVRLAAVRVGKSWRIHPQAWDDFLLACNPGKRLDQLPETPSVERLNREAAERLKRRLTRKQRR